MLARLSNSLLGFLIGLGRMTAFVIRIIKTLATTRLSSKLVIQQMYDIGIKTLPVLAAVCIFVGTNIALVGFHIFKQFGGQDLIGAYVGLTCIREMAPILVGAIMAAKPGTDISATIATMKVKQQIDALEVMAVDPFWFLIAPRIVAFVLVSPILVVFADFFCVGAAYLISIFQLKINSGKFINDMVTYLQYIDFFKGIAKGLISSLLVCIISCYFGYNSEPGPKGVSRAINISVVLESSLIVIINYFLTELMYGVK
ncbi:MAG: ABC transporter permease [Candidatus Sericytochromatia bacterium]|nr:ABC transporter permease [Candidatus Sericytochromatia bacterium]